MLKLEIKAPNTGQSVEREKRDFLSPSHLRVFAGYESLGEKENKGLPFSFLKLSGPNIYQSEPP